MRIAFLARSTERLSTLHKCMFFSQAARRRGGDAVARTLSAVAPAACFARRRRRSRLVRCAAWRPVLSGHDRRCKAPFVVRCRKRFSRGRGASASPDRALRGGPRVLLVDLVRRRAPALAVRPDGFFHDDLLRRSYVGRSWRRPEAADEGARGWSARALERRCRDSGQQATDSAAAAVIGEPLWRVAQSRYASWRAYAAAPHARAANAAARARRTAGPRDAAAARDATGGPARFDVDARSHLRCQPQLCCTRALPA